MLFVAHVDAQPTPPATTSVLCTATTQKVCRFDGVATACSFYGNSQRCDNATDAQCVSCNTPSRNQEDVDMLPPYAGGANCFPATKSCQVCSALSPATVSTRISNGYTLVLQKQCDVNFAQYAGVVRMDQPTTLAVKQITIETVPQANNEIRVQGRCPIFKFVGPEEISINRVTIECTSSADPATSAALIIQNTARVRLSLFSIRATKPDQIDRHGARWRLWSRWRPHQVADRCIRVVV